MFEFVLEGGAFFFSLRAELHAGDEPAEVLIAEAGGDEERDSKLTTETQRHRGRLRLLFLNCRSQFG